MAKYKIGTITLGKRQEKDHGCHVLDYLQFVVGSNGQERGDRLNENTLYSQLGMQRESSRMERTLIRVSKFLKARLEICKGKQWKRDNVIAAQRGVCQICCCNYRRGEEPVMHMVFYCEYYLH